MWTTSHHKFVDLVGAYVPTSMFCVSWFDSITQVKKHTSQQPASELLDGVKPLGQDWPTQTLKEWSVAHACISRKCQPRFSKKVMWRWAPLKTTIRTSSNNVGSRGCEAVDPDQPQSHANKWTDHECVCQAATTNSIKLYFGIPRNTFAIWQGFSHGRIIDAFLRIG